MMRRFVSAYGPRSVILTSDLFPGVGVFDHDFRAQGELAVGCGHLILREAVPIGGFAAMKALAIVRGQAVFPVPVVGVGELACQP